MKTTAATIPRVINITHSPITCPCNTRLALTDNVYPVPDSGTETMNFSILVDALVSLLEVHHFKGQKLAQFVAQDPIVGRAIARLE